MRVCWNWQTGTFEGRVCKSRVGSSPTTRTNDVSVRTIFEKTYNCKYFENCLTNSNYLCIIKIGNGETTNVVRQN